MISMTSLQERRIKLQADLAAETERHEKAITALRHETSENETLIAQEKAGLDHDKILLAEHVLGARGYGLGEGDKPAQVRAAIADILDGCKLLRREYFATKNYDRFRSQGTRHPYGYGPSHGSVNFQIGLSDPVRKRIREGGSLTADEIEAAVYYLTCIAQIEAATVKV